MSQPVSIDLHSLKLWERNYRQGDVDAIKTSIKRFGFNSAVRVKEEDGKPVVYAGNHAVKALREMYQEDPLQPPLNVLIDWGEAYHAQQEEAIWRVPAIRIDHLSPEEAKAFAIADNRTQELGQIDEEKLQELLNELMGQDLDLMLATGYTQGDLNPTLPDIDTDDDGQAFVDRAGELQEKWQVELGDKYLIESAYPGRPHVLVCGSATDEQTVAKLDLPEELLLMATDPPYGVEYDASWREKHSGGNYATGTLMNDDRADWSDVWILWRPQVLYAWHGALHSLEVLNGIERAEFEVRCQIIWVKPSLVFGRGHYHWRHEPCFFAVKKGQNANWQGSRTEDSVWECGNGSAYASSGDELDDFHAGHISQKPVELFKRSILNHTEPGDIVADPFGGSGSCLIACHATGRIGRSMDLDPKFIATTLERCESLGLTVTKV